MIIARCLAERPQLLIMNDLLHSLEKIDKLRILNVLIDKANPWTLICVSNDPLIMSACNRVVFMKKGEILMDQPYEEMVLHPDFKNVILQPEETENCLDDFIEPDDKDEGAKDA